MKFRDLMNGSDFIYSPNGTTQRRKIANPKGETCSYCDLPATNSVDVMGYLVHTHSDQEVKVYNPKTGEYDATV
jgi:hypothetical protein